MWAFRPVFHVFVGARNLGRVLATLPYFAFSVATFFPHSDGAKSFRSVGSSIQARWRIYQQTNQPMNQQTQWAQVLCLNFEHQEHMKYRVERSPILLNYFLSKRWHPYSA